jgi:hypothetical protein
MHRMYRNVSVSLLIPGGQSSKIRVGNTKNISAGFIGFSWVPNVRAGTGVLLVVGDSESSGSANSVIGDSPTQDTSCLDSQSPSSTAGTPAGALKTDSSSQSKQGGGGGKGGGGGGGSKSSHAGAIAGGVVGGVAACTMGGLLVLCFVHRSRRRSHPAAHIMDLLPDDAQRDLEHPLEVCQPEPFTVPLSHAENGRAGTERSSTSDVGHRYSVLSTAGASSGTSGNAVDAGGMGTGKSGPGPSQKSPEGMPQLRPVNIVMHEDAGGLPEASESQEGETETIELPPSYNSVRK